MKNKLHKPALIVIFSLLSSCLAVYSQVDIQQIIQPISFQLDNADFDEISKAERMVNEANEMGNDLVEEDKRLEKYFSKKEKKGEKKSVYAKQYRTDMTRKYIEGLTQLHNVLNDRLNFAIFEYPQDQSTVNGLRTESDDLFATANQNYSVYDGLSKKDYNNYKYYSMVSEFETIVQLMLSGIDKQIDAFAIWASQTEKKQKEIAEENAWASAMNSNTIPAYQEYIQKYQKGKYREQAERKISEIKEKERLAAEQAEAERLKKEEEARLEAERLEAERLAALQQQEKEAEPEPEPTGLSYSIQIMAVYFKVDETKLKKIYSGELEVKERFEDGMYKYTIGEFPTFKEAEKYRKSCLDIPSFVVAFENGQRISTKEAKKAEASQKQ